MDNKNVNMVTAKYPTISNFKFLFEFLNITKTLCY